ncbi:hypothetical protein ACET3Z_024467 [Daucus carota]
MAWDDLLHELLSIIFQKLITNKQNVPDLYQCLGVCTSWRHLAKEFLTTLAPAPWLLLEQKIRPQSITFSTITCKIPINADRSARKTTLSFSLFDHAKAYASYDGWLLVGYDDKVFHSSTAFLYNPLSAIILQLPPFAEHLRLDEHSTIKFVMSEGCPTDPRCVLCVKFKVGDGLALAFCKPAPSSDDNILKGKRCLLSSASAYWAVLEKDSSEIEDMIFYCGKFYTIDRYAALSVHNYDANANGFTSETVIVDWFNVFNYNQTRRVSGRSSYQNVAIRRVGSRSNYRNCNSLVKSKRGDLLMIKRVFSNNFSRVTESCSIYKLNMSNIDYYYWSEVNNLEDKEALFLGWHDCISVSISDGYPGFKQNHIYFFDNYSPAGKVIRYGVYDLKTRTFLYYSDDNGMDRDAEGYKCCRLFAPSALS